MIPIFPTALNLTPSQIADLLELVLWSTHFQCNGSIYEQQDGAAMDSPVSAVTADLYMEGSGGDILKTSIFTLETRQITFFSDSFHYTKKNL